MNSRGVGSASETSGCAQHISICLGRKQGFRLASPTSKVIKAYKQRIRQLKFQSASEWTARSRWRTLCASLMRNPQTSGVSWHLHLPIRFTNIHPCARKQTHSWQQCFVCGYFVNIEAYRFSFAAATEQGMPCSSGCRKLICNPSPESRIGDCEPATTDCSFRDANQLLIDAGDVARYRTLAAARTSLPSTHGERAYAIQMLVFLCVILKIYSFVSIICLPIHARPCCSHRPVFSTAPSIDHSSRIPCMQCDCRSQPRKREDTSMPFGGACSSQKTPITRHVA